MLKQTPLNASHRTLNAKLTDFGGWEMPLHYGSQIEEHHAVRRHAGMFDVSHMLAVDISGAASKPFLSRLLANDAEKLATPGRAMYSCMLNAQGGVIDDLIAYWLGDSDFRLVVNAGTADKDIAWMNAQAKAMNLNVRIMPRRDLAMIAVQGPEARAKIWGVIPGSQAATENLAAFNAITVGEYFIARTGYTGEDGFEILMPAASAEALWNKLLAAGVSPCGLGARDTLRLEAGMNLYGQDMDENINPLESGLGWTVDLRSPRIFNGKEALAAMTPAKKLVGLLLLEKSGVLRAHQKVVTPLGEGEITSGGFSPTMERSIAFARVPAGVQAGDTAQVAVRDKMLNVKIVRLPFVRHGRILIKE
ncbi:MAG: glycine cleavage system aminomethyltransferase GcvT [Burkholderiales bacterium]